LLYHHLGAHLDQQEGRPGTRFAVWAPNAREVSVLTDRNYWSPGANTLNPSENGVWWGFVPDMGHGDSYKYGIRSQDGRLLEKHDPVGFYSELRPRTASIVWNIYDYDWNDSDWMSRRAETDWLHEPMSVYEVHLGSWKRPPGREYHNYRELAPMLVDYCHEMGYTHLQLMPITEYPFDGSWGYQCTGYFAPTSRFGTPQDFMWFVDHCHQNGIGVLVDWVPAHFPKDEFSLAQFDGTHLYEHSDPRQGAHPDWGTLIFNYGRFEVKDFLINSARFWFEMYHVDGLRVDAVASMLYLDYSRNEGEWLPNMYGGRENLEAIQFLREMNGMVHADFPGAMMIAEESTSWGGVSRPIHDGGIGFTFKWDMGWMNDTLGYMDREPIHRSHHQNELSFRMIYAFTENFMLPLSHDEVVHGKKSLLSQMPGDPWQQFANLRLLYAYQYVQPGKKLLFMGGELGQWHEWNHNEQIDWPLLNEPLHGGLKTLVRDLNHIYRNESSLYEGDVKPEGFAWIQCDDHANSVFALTRHSLSDDDFIVAVLNFTPVPRNGYRIGVPRRAGYRVILNTDASVYGGSNAGTGGELHAEPIESHHRPYSVQLNLPPLGMLLLRPI